MDLEVWCLFRGLYASGKSANGNEVFTKYSISSFCLVSMVRKAFEGEDLLKAFDTIDCSK